MRFSPRQIVCGLALAVALAGCSSSNTGSDSGAPTTGDALQQVANMIRDYSSEKGRPPAKLGDMAGLKNLYNIGYAAVEKGDVVVVWGTSVAGEGGGGGGGGVVAYEKSAPDSGGAVLLQDGSVKQMTADEFKAAKR